VTYPLTAIPSRLFREAALAQGRCQNCGLRRGKLDAHHVLYEQHLRREGLPRFERANALLLCALCHQRHHARSAVLPTSVLRDENLAYLTQSLGAPRALEYLRRYYDAEVRDVRVLELAKSVESHDAKGPDQ
jgi:cytochrome c553